MFDYMHTVLNGLKAWVIGEVNKLLSKIDAVGFPDGGAAGQLLSKTESGTEWIDPPQSGVQPDWNQNDDTQPDYVKNRPFYTGGPVETVFVEESTVSFADDGGIYVAKFPSTFMPTVGEIHKVYWDGTVYECTCVAFPGGTTLGNLSITDAGSDTGEPFILEIDNDGFIYISTADTSASHTISISRDAEAESVVKIDRKYLPKAAVITYNSISNTYSSDLTVEELHEILSDGKQVVYSNTNKIGYNYLISWEETPSGRIDLTFGESVSVSLFPDGTIGATPAN